MYQIFETSKGEHKTPKEHEKYNDEDSPSAIFKKFNKNLQNLKF